MSRAIGSKKWLVGGLIILAVMACNITSAAEIIAADLPPTAQVNQALDNHLLVLNAQSGLRLELANQNKWNSGNYEFNLRAGSGQRQVVSTEQKLKEWDVSLERPLRLPNKANIDHDIGAANVAKADFALGDAHHEAARLLLHFWFAFLREQAQVALWQQQVGIYAQQADIVEKRVKAGDAPKLELNLARAAHAQAQVSLQQANLRLQMAGNDMQRQFPAITLPDAIATQTPQAITENLAVWQARILDDNHELGLAQSQAQVQQLLAKRSRADQVPDPTIGLRYSNEMGGNEKVTGLYFTVPLSFGVRSVNAQVIEQQANIAADQAEYVKHRLQSDIYAAYQQAVQSYTTWQQAREAAVAIRSNADLIAKAYKLGESNLSDNLSARRIAHEASLAENISQLDANEARYRLQLDGHQLWKHEEDEHESK